jgi:hypothetical protein
VNLLELFDRAFQRRHERMLARPIRPPMDFKVFVGLLFLAGYYAMVWRFSGRELPAANLDLIRDAMLTLGPPVGAIVAALFRSDARDAQATANTGEAMRAMGKVADAVGSGGSMPHETIKTGDEVTITKPAEEGKSGD